MLPVDTGRIIIAVNTGSEITSTFATAMGASVRVAGPPRGMYLVIGAAALPEALAERAGGKTVMNLNGHKLLAVLPFEGYLRLKDDTRVTHIGPVTVDMNRLTAIARLLAVPGVPVSGDA